MFVSLSITEKRGKYFVVALKSLNCKIVLLFVFCNFIISKESVPLWRIVWRINTNKVSVPLWRIVWGINTNKELVPLWRIVWGINTNKVAVPLANSLGNQYE